MNRAEFQERFRTAPSREVLSHRRNEARHQEAASPKMIVVFQKDYYGAGSDSPLHRAGKTCEMPEAAALILIDLKFCKPAVDVWERR